jgi:hypothetical protein
MAGAPRNRVPSRRLTVAAALTGVLLAAGVWQRLAYLRGPGPVAAEFVAAIERHDVDRVYALALDQEKSEMGLTQAGTGRALDEIFYRLAPEVQGSPSRNGDDDPRATNWYTRFVAWTDTRTGQELPSRSHTGEFRTMIDLFRMPDGRWRVSFTRLAAEWLLFNMLPAGYHGVPDADKWTWLRHWREAQLRRWRLPETYYDPATVRVDGHVVALLDTAAYDPVKRADWKVER